MLDFKNGQEHSNAMLVSMHMYLISNSYMFTIRSAQEIMLIQPPGSHELFGNWMTTSVNKPQGSEVLRRPYVPCSCRFPGDFR